ncbi:MAG: ATP-binding protein [Spirochaetes bacterium]|nr:ATP-binding protein [Spirochaetota bacterium]
MPTTPTAEKGKLLLKNWNFEKNGPVNLDGDWEFYWNALYFPKDFQNSTIQKEPYFYQSRKPWNNLVINNNQLTEDGYATFRLTVELPEKDKIYSFYTTNQDSAYKLWINGEVLAENGRVGKNKENHLPQRLPLIFQHYAQSTTLEMVIQISNFSHRMGGLVNLIKMGDHQQILSMYNKHISYALFLFGCLFIISLYHLGLFLLRRNDFSTLFFSIFCLLIGIRILFSGDYLIFQFIPNFPWVLGVKIPYLTFYLAVLFFVLFFYSLFSSDIPVLLLRIVIFISTAISIITSVFSVKVMNYILNFYKIYTVTISCFITFFLIVIILKKQENSKNQKQDAIVLTCGLMMFFMTGIYDFAADSHLINGLEISPITPFGVLLFIFTQSFLLSLRFSRAFNKLDDLSMNLEKKVSQRTAELKDANNKLETAEKEKTNFFINLSHEMKTPLTVISNYLDDMPELENNSDLKIIKHNIEKLKQDMINFFDILKMERGQKLYNDIQIINFSDFLNNKINFFMKFALKDHIKITHNIETGLYLETPISLIDRIFNNLIHNAIKFNKKNGFIDIITEKKENQIIIHIKDTGCGIDRVHINNIFKPYYQISHIKKNIEGIGMGLAIVKKCVVSLKGTITVESVVNEYTDFEIKLPLHTLANDDYVADITKNRESSGYLEIRAEKIRDRDPGTNERKKNTILVVEDNKDLLNLIERHLLKKYNVFICHNGTEALNILKENQCPDLIISDIMMDKMDGFELLSNIHKNMNWCRIPFIFISARTDDESKIAGIQKGAIDYIYKPFTLSELFIKIDSLLRYQELNTKYQEQRKFADLGIMLGGLSHEIFNPLSGISGPLANIKKIMQQAGNKDTKIIKHLNFIEESVDKITSLINVLKDLTSTKQLNSTKINLKSFTEYIINDLSKSNEITFKLNIPDDFYIQADENTLAIILRNLIQNGCDSINKGGTITVNAKNKKNETIIQVIDNGSGIKNSDINKIFQAFYSTKTKQKGSGLGLYIVKQLVQKMNWSIEVSSRINSGTTFSLLSTPKET